MAPGANSRDARGGAQDRGRPCIANDAREPDARGATLLVGSRNGHRPGEKAPIERGHEVEPRRETKNNSLAA